MKIHEYQAKELLQQAGAAIPRGIVACSPDEAVKAFDQFGGKPVVLKAQVHAGGRGKGHFKGHSDSKLGGVKFLTKREDVARVAEVMLKYPLVTKQTGEEGQKVSRLLVQEAADFGDKDQKYVAVVLDRGAGMPLLMGSAEGGMDIEEVAEKHPDKIVKTHIEPGLGLQPCQARRLAYDLGFSGNQIEKAEKLLHSLVRVFLEKDCNIAEINPLVVTTSGEILAIDAKMVFDDNALFRHPDVQAMRDESEEDPAEVRAAKANLSFIRLSGNIGCLVNGAGLAMSTMDIIKYHGGQPANFLDVGGGVSAEGAIEAFRIILSDSNVKSILVNIFGGIAKCDLIAEALVKAGRDIGFKVPVIVRLEGTNVDKAREILAGVRGELPMIQSANGLTEAAQKAVAAAK